MSFERVGGGNVQLLSEGLTLSDFEASFTVAQTRFFASMSQNSSDQILFASMSPGLRRGKWGSKLQGGLQDT